MPDDSTQREASQASKSAIEKHLADARLRLVETGTRNRLVHTPRSSKRTRSLPILNVGADGLFDTLVRSGKSMRFLPTNTLPASAPEAALQTNLDARSLEKRLLTIYRDAKTAEEEQGINILFLAIGFLRWYEDEKSEVMREAPLVLVPVSLIRDARHSTFHLRTREEDIATNQAIQERLRTDFGITLPDIPEDEEWRPAEYFAAAHEVIATKSRWSIDPDGVELGFYSFSKLLMIRDLEPEAWAEKSILEHPLLRGLLSEGFNEEPSFVDGDAALDELFAPSELIQVLDADSSQTIVIETVRAGRNLVVQGPPGTGKSQTITNIIAAAVHDGKSVLFVAEKMAALNVVHSRLRHIGLGPICLELHSRGANKKQVLGQLEETLGQQAVEPNPQTEVMRLTELRDTLNAVAKRMHATVGKTGTTPYRALSRLVAAAEKGVTSYTALLGEAAKWSQADFASIMQNAVYLAEITATAGPCFEHPYYGVERTQLQPAGSRRLSEPKAVLAEAAMALANRLEALSGDLGIEREVSLDSGAVLVSILRIIESIPPGTAEIAAAIAASKKPSRILEAVCAGIAWNDLRVAHAEAFVEAAWDTPAAPLRLSLITGVTFFGRLGSAYRRNSGILATLIRGPLPRKAQERIELVDRLLTVEKAHEALKAENAAMSALLPVHWRGEKTDFATLLAAASAVQELTSHIARPRIENCIEIAKQNRPTDYIAEITRLAEDWYAPQMASSNPQCRHFQGFSGRRAKPDSTSKPRCQGTVVARCPSALRRVAAALGYRRALRALPAAALADALATRSMPPEKGKAALDCTHAEAVWSQAIAAMPALQEFYGPQHDAMAEEFRSLEAKRRRTTVDIIRGRHSANMPRGNFGSMNTIRSEIKRKRGHMPIRKLFRGAGETLQRIKPVLLMSPISAAQFLPPGSVEFDLLVIDEASQVRPEDALGLVARAKQLVVVGDNKQLPPTTFFDRIVADEEEHDEDEEEADAALAGAAKATQHESILALCEARGLNSAMLRWHYRSRHPSLIEVSNAEFYRHLIMPPAPSAERADEGLVLRRVAGEYDRGGKRINKIEAEAVANAVAEHARTTPELSLGVVTFSSPQRDAISDLLEIKRRNDDALDSFLREGKSEDTFVKNLENVQGDERDVILVSVGYGPRIAGARLDSMAFGPVSKDGGERRLNVLFTRARSRCEIFCSFTSGDIDPDRAKREGPRVLKRFLQYAETGVLEQHEPLSAGCGLAV